VARLPAVSAAPTCDMMDDESGSEPRPQRPWYLRKRALFALFAFYALSAGFHFIAGPALTALSPAWKFAALPDQTVSIVTLSHREQPEVAPTDAPTPTPPPARDDRTKRAITLVKYRELAGAVTHRQIIRPPARRTLKILVEQPTRLRPSDEAPGAKVAIVAPSQTPLASPTPGQAPVDTSGQNELTGSMEWGDDNPPRVIKRAALAIADDAPGIARVDVQVGPDGQVLAVTLLQSSGDPAVDQAALDAARASQFAPATANGVPIHGSCEVDFGPPVTTQS